MLSTQKLTKTKVINLLNQAAEIPPKKIDDDLSSYADLQERGRYKELQLEHAKLLALFQNQDLSVDQIKTKFLALCQSRDNENQNSCLYYAAFGDNDCNQLYRDIATLLFKPKSLFEMLTILMPSIKHALTLNFEVEPPQYLSQLLRDRVKVSIVKKEVSATTNVPWSMAALSEYVIRDGYIFHVNEIARLSLGLHCKVYDALDQYPTIKKSLYDHNDQLQQAEFDITCHLQTSLTPRQMILRFSQSLLRSGTQYTGKSFATNLALNASAQFRGYLDSLPEDFRLSLFSLSGGYEATLPFIMNALARGKCVVRVSDLLKQLSQVKSPILDQYPPMDPALKNQVKQRFQKTLNTQGNDHATALPVSLKKIIFPSIRLSWREDWLDLFINLPTTEFADILSYLPHFVSKVMRSPKDLSVRLGLLSREQVDAFIDAIVYSSTEASHKVNALFLIVESLDVATLKKYFSVGFIKSYLLRNLDARRHKTLLHAAARNENPDMIRYLLDLIHKRNRQSAILSSDDKGLTPLYYASRNKNPNVVVKTLSDFSSQKTLKNILQKSGCLEMPDGIHKAAPINTYVAMLKLIPETACKEIIQRHHREYQSDSEELKGDCIFYAMVGESASEDSIHFIFSHLNQTERLQLLEHGDWYHSIMEEVFIQGTVSQLRTFLSYYNHDEVVNGMSLSDENHNALKIVARDEGADVEAMKILLSYLSVTRQKEEISKNNFNLLKTAAQSNSRALQELCQVYTKDELEIIVRLNVDILINVLQFNESATRVRSALTILLDGFSDTKRMEMYDAMVVAIREVKNIIDINIQALLEFYPMPMRKAKLNEMSIFKKLVVEDVYDTDYHFDYIYSLISLLPQSDRLYFIKEANLLHTILNRLTSNDERDRQITLTYLTKIILLLAPDDRTLALKQCNSAGMTVIEVAANHAIDHANNLVILMKLLSRLPEEDRLAAMTYKRYERSIIAGINSIILYDYYKQTLLVVAFKSLYRELFSTAAIPTEQDILAEAALLPTEQITTKINACDNTTLAFKLWASLNATLSITHTVEDTPNLISAARAHYQTNYLSHKRPLQPSPPTHGYWLRQFGHPPNVAEDDVTVPPVNKRLRGR